eukprot:1427461-Pyramimonas_sp.AAC.1
MVGHRHQGQLCPQGGHRPCLDGRDVAVHGVPHRDPAAGHPEVLRQHWLLAAAPSGTPSAVPGSGAGLGGAALHGPKAPSPAA